MNTPVPPPGVVAAHCYARVSKKDQRPEIQRAQFEAFCARRGWPPIFYEERIKGSRNDRPAFLSAVAAALTGLATGPQAFVIVALDRFAREQVFMLTQLKELRSRGVLTCSMAEEWLERDDAARPILLGVHSGLAESELVTLRRRTAAAQSLARDEGKHIGRPFKPEALLLEAKRLIAAEGLTLREAVARVNRGQPERPEHPGGLCRLSVATLHRFLSGEWQARREAREKAIRARRKAVP